MNNMHHQIQWSYFLTIHPGQLWRYHSHNHNTIQLNLWIFCCIIVITVIIITINYYNDETIRKRRKMSLLQIHIIMPHAKQHTGAERCAEAWWDCWPITYWCRTTYGATSWRAEYALDLLRIGPVLSSTARCAAIAKVLSLAPVNNAVLADILPSTCQSNRNTQVFTHNFWSSEWQPWTITLSRWSKHKYIKSNIPVVKGTKAQT